jgi:ATP-dependent Clp protease ATP-binding subunit ClpA
MGVLLSEIRQEVEKLLACRWLPDWAEPIRVTPRLSEVLTIALDECRKDAGTQINPTHLWRAIRKEGNSLPARVALGQKDAPLVATAAPTATAASSGKQPLLLAPQLQDWCYDLTALAETGKLNPVLGRDDLMER